MAEESELLEVGDIPVEDVVIDISWLSSMKEKLASTYRTESSPSFTICRVPASIREYDHAAYNPRVVSIGPFHHRSENLRAMQEHKWRSVIKVLEFGKIGGNDLEKLLKEMKVLEARARNCYEVLFTMSSNNFVEMMVLDGCFNIIFLILQHMGSIELDVLIFRNYRIVSLIYLDMLLLENQLPFFVLECLWELIGQPRDILSNAVLTSFEYLFSCNLELRSPDVIHHLLHLVHLSLKPDSPTRKAQTTSASGKQSLSHSKGKSPPRLNTITSATELQEAGVRFQLKQDRSFFQFRFERGSMEIPRLWIYDDSDTNILFRNLMAFEECFTYFGNHCTTYCVFIDFLVDTPRDVSILKEAGIIRNSSGSNVEVALLFNKLGKEIDSSFDLTYLTNLFDEVNQHTQKRRIKWQAKWSKWWAKLVHDYFDSPWTIIKLIAAVIILVLTFLQTYFSASNYFKPGMP